MTCAYCEKAKAMADFPMYQAKCHGCMVRSFAMGVQYFNSEKSGRLLPEYRNALEVAFGMNWQAAHEEIKAESERIKALKERGNRGQGEFE